jgi:hypothetical protein
MVLCRLMSAFTVAIGGKADIEVQGLYFRLRPNADLGTQRSPNLPDSLARSQV